MSVADGVLGAAILVVVGVFAGNWLDERLHTAPWMSVGLAMLGGGLGLWRLCIKALALDTSGSGKKAGTLTGRGTKQFPPKPSTTGSSGGADQDGGTSAPKAAYERFMDDEQD